MPIKVIKNLPAIEKLAAENIFIMDSGRALHQDIRPLEILIVNLMPTKTATEVQLLQALSNTPLQLNITFLRMTSHIAHNVSSQYLSEFYQTFSEIRAKNFDGMIVTGAPVEELAFEEVDYWQELSDLLDWAKSHVYSSFYICWGAQAALYHHYGIEKVSLAKKLFGIYENRVAKPNHSLMRGFGEVFNMPHSRHTTIARANLTQFPELEILAESAATGISILADTAAKEVFVFGHAEYDSDTLDKEYQRDIAAGLPIDLPVNYYPNDDPQKRPVNRWRATSSLLYTNWLNYYVYQETPYQLSESKFDSRRN